MSAFLHQYQVTLLIIYVVYIFIHSLTNLLNYFVDESLIISRFEREVRGVGHGSGTGPGIGKKSNLIYFYLHLNTINYL